jgi:hypothetical protein
MEDQVFLVVGFVEAGAEDAAFIGLVFQAVGDVFHTPGSPQMIHIGPAKSWVGVNKEPGENRVLDGTAIVQNVQ